jgi:hypothetical protein
MLLNIVVLSALLIASAAANMDSLRHCEAISTLNGQLFCRCSGIKMAAHIYLCTKE